MNFDIHPVNIPALTKNQIQGWKIQRSLLHTLKSYLLNIKKVIYPIFSRGESLTYNEPRK